VKIADDFPLVRTELECIPSILRLKRIMTNIDAPRVQP